MRDLGKLLQEERLQRQITLKEVSERTRISVRMLETIEDGNFAQIRTPLLIKSFLRSYCSVLGMDAEPLIERHALDIAACARNAEGEQTARLLAHPVHRKSRVAFFVAMVLAILVAGAWMLQVWVAKRSHDMQSVPQSMATDTGAHDALQMELSRRESAAPKVETMEPEASQATGETAVTTGQEIPAATAEPGGGSPPAEEQMTPSSAAPVAGSSGRSEGQGSPVQSTSLPSTEIAGMSEIADFQTGLATGGAAVEGANSTSVPSVLPAGKHRLVVEASKETWIQVRVDGKGAVSALMKPGQKREWEANEYVRLVIGNAGGVSLNWDDRPLELAGKEGQVVRLRLPDEKREKTTP